MATTAMLLSDVTTNTTGSGKAMSDPCTVQIDGSTGGGTVVVEAAIDDVDANYKCIGPEGSQPGPALVHCQFMGDYYIRAKLLNAGSGASVTVRANN